MLEIRKYRSIKAKIITTAIAGVLCVAVFTTGVMMYNIGVLTNTLVEDLLRPLTKISSQTVEGNLHILADRILSLSDRGTLKLNLSGCLYIHQMENFIVVRKIVRNQ